MGCEPLGLDDFLELWRTILPDSYTDAIEHDGSGRGMDVPALQAAIFAEFCEALEQNWQSFYIERHSDQTRPPGTGPTTAAGAVELRRTAPTLGDIYVPAGTQFDAQVTDSFGQVRTVGTYVSLVAVTLASGNSGPVSVEVAASYIGASGNIKAGLISGFHPIQNKVGSVLVVNTGTISRIADPSNAVTNSWTQGDVGRSGRLVGALASINAGLPRRIVGFSDGAPQVFTVSPPLDNPADIGAVISFELEQLADFGVTVSQPAPIAGGAGGALDAAGVDRGIGRSFGELDQDYADRLETLQDTVSPSAIERILDCTLSACGIRWQLAETRDVDSLMGFTLDVHPVDYGSLALVSTPMGSQYVGQGGVLMGPGTEVRFFMVTVSGPDLTTESVGLSFEDGPEPAAFDGDQPLDGEIAESGAEYINCIASAYARVDAARAAGVGFIFVQDFNL